MKMLESQVPEMKDFFSYITELCKVLAYKFEVCLAIKPG